MLRVFNFLFEGTRKIRKKLLSITGTFLFKVYLKSAVNVSIGDNFRSNGFSFLRLKRSSRVVIGDNLKLNNGEIFNSIGRQHRCIIVVKDNAELKIGNHVGISSSAIYCSKRVTIGNHVKIGGNVCIYDTDFHSLNAVTRRTKSQDLKQALSKEVHIGNDVFIGAHSTILKGVTIGDRAIIGAGSVISKNVPHDEVWAGNPAKFIRHNSYQQISLQHL